MSESRSDESGRPKQTRKETARTSQRKKAAIIGSVAASFFALVGMGIYHEKNKNA